MIDAVNLTKAFGDRVIFENVNFRLPPGGIVGIIGPNGAGKTTLLKMLMGQEGAHVGELQFGPTVALGYVDQSRDTLDPNKTVWEEISGGLDLIEMGKKQVNSRAYVSRFNFQKTDQQKKVGVLSAASATASTWPSCSAAGRTCSCWTNRPTTWTSTPSARWRRRSPRSWAARWW